MQPTWKWCWHPLSRLSLLRGAERPLSVAKFGGSLARDPPIHPLTIINMEQLLLVTTPTTTSTTVTTTVAATTMTTSGPSGLGHYVDPFWIKEAYNISQKPCPPSITNPMIAGAAAFTTHKKYIVVSHSLYTEKVMQYAYSPEQIQMPKFAYLDCYASALYPSNPKTCIITCHLLKINDRTSVDVFIVPTSDDRALQAVMEGTCPSSKYKVSAWLKTVPTNSSFPAPPLPLWDTMFKRVNAGHPFLEGLSQKISEINSSCATSQNISTCTPTQHTDTEEIDIVNVNDSDTANPRGRPESSTPSDGESDSYSGRERRRKLTHHKRAGPTPQDSSQDREHNPNLNESSQEIIYPTQEIEEPKKKYKKRKLTSGSDRIKSSKIPAQAKTDSEMELGSDITVTASNPALEAVGLCYIPVRRSTRNKTPTQEKTSKPNTSKTANLQKPAKPAKPTSQPQPPAANPAPAVNPAPAPNPTPPKPKIPPIIIKAQASFDKFKKLCFNIDPAKQFQISALPRAQGFQIFTFTEARHQAFIKGLEDNKVPFYTHTPKPHPTATVVIRGLLPGISDQEVAEALKEEHGIQADAVTTINVRGAPCPLKRVTYNSTLKENRLIWNIQTLLYHRVTIETPIPQGDPICKNCSAIGHIAKWCKLTGPTVACSYCAGPHPLQDCNYEWQDDGNEHLKCARCGEKHRSTYKGCPEYAKIQAKKTGRSITPISTQPPPTQDTRPAAQPATKGWTRNPLKKGEIQPSNSHIYLNETSADEIQPTPTPPRKARPRARSRSQSRVRVTIPPAEPQRRQEPPAQSAGMDALIQELRKNTDMMQSMMTMMMRVIELLLAQLPANRNG